jgi:hypothetical protein
MIAPQTIDEALLPRAQNLLRQRREISERPKKTCTFMQTGLYITGSDRRVDLEYAIREFFDPHERAPGETFLYLLQVGNYCTCGGTMGRNLLIERAFFSGKRGGVLATALLGQFEMGRQRSGDLRQQLDAVQGCGYTDPFAVRLLHPYDRGLTECPSTGPKA